MSNSSNRKRQSYKQKQERQGKNVITWIVACLLILTILSMIYFFNI